MQKNGTRVSHSYFREKIRDDRSMQNVMKDPNIESIRNLSGLKLIK